MLRIGLLFCSAICFLTFHPLRLQAQWVQANGPYGGSITALVANGNILFAGTISGVFRSDDNGANWTRSNSGIENFDITTLYSSGCNVFAQNFEGIYRFDNTQNSWVKINDTYFSNVSEKLSFSEYGKNLFACTVPSERLSDPSGTSNQVFLSTNNGATWAKIYTSESNNNEIVTSLMAIDENLVLGTNRGAFCLSKGASNWAKVDSGLANIFVNSFTKIDNHLYAATQDGVYLSLNNGISWTGLNSNPTTKNVESIAVNENALFANTDSNGIFVSTNKGQSWEKSTSTIAFSLAVIGKSCFASTNKGVLQSIDNGKNWSMVNNGLTSMITDLLSIEKNIFAGTNNGIFLSTDEGKSWADVSIGLPYEYVTGLIEFGNQLFAGTLSGVFVTKDNGKNWEEANTGLTNRHINDFTICDNSLFVATSVGAFRFENTGRTWTKANYGIGGTIVYALNASNGFLFAGTLYNLIRSNDYGKTWTYSDSGLMISRGLTFLYVKNDNLFASAGSEFYQSVNDGNSWKKISTGLTGFPVTDLVIRGDTLFSGTREGIFWSTMKNNYNWIKINAEPNLSYINTLEVSDKSLFAGTALEGIWRLPLSEITSEVAKTTFNNNSFMENIQITTRAKSSVAIQFYLQCSERISIKLYTISGKEVFSFYNRLFNSGLHTVVCNMQNTKSGTFVIAMQSHNNQFINRFTLLQ